MTLVVEPLTQAAFAPFGTVIETAGAKSFPINQGTTTRFHGLAQSDPGPDGHSILSIFRGRPRPVPIRIEMLERHPLATQAFVPLAPRDWLVVVASKPDASALRCFRATGSQGVQYGVGVWHHPLLVLDEPQDFLIVDRDGPGENLEEVQLSSAATIQP